MAFLDSQDGDVNLSHLTLVVTTEQFRLESCGLTGREGIEGVIDAVNQLPGPDFVTNRVGGVNGVTANRGGEVNLDKITGGNGAVNGYECSEPLPQGVQLSVNSFLVRCDRLHLEGVLGVIGKVKLGSNIYLDGDHQVAGEIFIARPRGDIRFGATNGANAFSGDGLLEKTIQTFRHGVVQHFTAADSLINDRRWHLAFAEAGDADLLGDVLIGVVKAGFKLF